MSNLLKTKSFARSSKTRDERPSNKPKISRAERDYNRSLVALGRHVGNLISAFPPGDPSILPSLEQMLEAYSNALTPWAVQTASRMIQEVNERDRDTWRRLGNSISDQLRRDLLGADVGNILRDRLSTQVKLIKSLPIEAGQRVHELTLKGLEDSTRYQSYIDEILRSGEVTESRATLIARTETSRTASLLTQSRAENAGSEGYIWRTSHDGTVRPSHKVMEGKYVDWNNPPTLDNLTGHAGALPNCRCYPEPTLPKS